jgi:glycosyltransferase involved in cell wall biosynthesis
MKKIKIVIPIYNDWEGFIKIVSKIESLHQETELDIEIIAVNDCSTISLNEAINSKLLKITLINLAKNSGNQKAISIGLNYINEKYNDKEFDYVIIMDSDGEDKPEDISKLVEECAKRKKIIFAKRNKRNETFFFKFLYFIYKISFKILTKEQIDFGNFSCVPAAHIKKLVDLDDIDLHYAASIVKSKLKFEKILCDKGPRYYGNTKLKFNKHLLHGLISLSLFSEIIAVNTFFTSIVSMFTLTLGAVLVLVMKIFLNIALLGWTSIILISLFILFIIFFLLSMFSLIILLNKNNYSKSNKTFNKELISSIKTFE